MTNLLNRRAVVRAIPFLAAAGAVPVIMAEEVEAAPMTAQERRDFHLAEFKKAMQEIDPSISYWMESHGEKTHGLIAFCATGHYEGDGIYEGGVENVFGHRGRWNVKLLPGMKDGERYFSVWCPGEHMKLTESHLNAFVGRKLPRAGRA